LTSSTTGQDFHVEHPEWVKLIQRLALKEFQKAYIGYGISVESGTYHPEFSTDCNTLSNLCYLQVQDQSYGAYVVGDFPGPGCGIGTPTISKDPRSKIYYFDILGEAQIALRTSPGQDLSPPYPPKNAKDLADLTRLMAAVGTAIGRGSAHEMGHKLELITVNGAAGFPNMDCGPGRAYACENNNNYVYNFWSCKGYPQYPDNPNDKGAGGQFFYVDVPGHPIHWPPSNVCWLENHGVSLKCTGN
jgi:hypothetical protein